MTSPGPVTLSIAALSLILGFSVSWTTQDLAGPPVRALTLDELFYNYETGTVTQRLSGNVTADWTASIIETENGVNRILCRGSNEPGQPGTYNGQRTTWDLDDWTNDECPDPSELKPGITLEAAWTYTDENGLLRTVIGEYTLGAEP